MSWSRPTISRRRFVAGSVGVLIAGEWLPRSGRLAVAEQIGRRRSAPSDSIRAVVFDVFGTVVDWRSSVADEVTAFAKRKGVNVDGATFADAWRAEYFPSMDRVRSGALPWTNLDRLHRMVLDKLLVQFNVAHVSEAEAEALNRAWHRLRPWPDAVQGLQRLKAKFTIAPLSNGNIALMTDMAKHAGLPCDCILGA